MIKTILFDVDNTLLDYNECALYSMKKSCKKFDVPFSNKLMTEFDDINDLLWHKLELGEISKQQLHQQRSELLFERLSICANGRDFDDFYRSQFSDSHFLTNGAMEVLETLHKKYSLYVVSNASFEMQMKRLSNAKILNYFKEIFVSDKVGYAKPDKQFFDVVLNRIGVENKNEVLIVGDSLTADISGGIKSGIKTCFFNVNNVEKEKIVDYEKIDWTISSLFELLNIV